MKALIQRVKSASVTVEGNSVGAIDHGLLALVGVEKGDSEGSLCAYVVFESYLAAKACVDHGSGSMHYNTTVCWYIDTLDAAA